MSEERALSAVSEQDVTEQDVTEQDVTEPVAPVRPLLRAVRGTPDDLELAALTAVVAALASGGAPEPAPATPEAWGRPDSLVRGRHVDRPGPGAWLRSGLPV